MKNYATLHILPGQFGTFNVKMVQSKILELDIPYARQSFMFCVRYNALHEINTYYLD